MTSVISNVTYLRLAFIGVVESCFLLLFRNLGDSGRKHSIMTATSAGIDIIIAYNLHPILLSTRRANPFEVVIPEFQNIVITTTPAALEKSM